MSSSKVSILIPAYKANWFEEALRSAVVQTWRNSEIIISDDCPTEAIRDIAERYVAGHPDRVRYIRNPNPGRAGFNNMLHLIGMASGDYLKFLFDDDTLEPDCVAELVRGLDGDPRCGLAFSLRRTIDENSRATGVINYFGNSPTGYVSARDICRYATLNCVNPIGELTTVLMRAKDIKVDPPSRMFTLMGDDPRSLGDIAVYVNLGLQCDRFYYCNRVLSSFRKSSMQNSGAGSGIYQYSISEWMKLMRSGVTSRLVTADEAINATHFFRKKWTGKYPSDPALQAVVNEAADEQLAWLSAGGH